MAGCRTRCSCGSRWEAGTFPACGSWPERWGWRLGPGRPASRSCRGNKLVVERVAGAGASGGSLVAGGSTGWADTARAGTGHNGGASCNIGRKGPLLPQEVSCCTVPPQEQQGRPRLHEHHRGGVPLPGQHGPEKQRAEQVAMRPLSPTRKGDRAEAAVEPNPKRRRCRLSTSVALSASPADCSDGVAVSEVGAVGDSGHPASVAPLVAVGSAAPWEAPAAPLPVGLGSPALATALSSGASAGSAPPQPQPQPPRAITSAGSATRLSVARGAGGGRWGLSTIDEGGSSGDESSGCGNGHTASFRPDPHGGTAATGWAATPNAPPTSPGVRAGGCAAAAPACLAPTGIAPGGAYAQLPAGRSVPGSLAAPERVVSTGADFQRSLPPAAQHEARCISGSSFRVSLRAAKELFAHVEDSKVAAGSTPVSVDLWAAGPEPARAGAAPKMEHEVSAPAPAPRGTADAQQPPHL